MVSSSVLLKHASVTVSFSLFHGSEGFITNKTISGHVMVCVVQAACLFVFNALIRHTLESKRKEGNTSALSDLSNLSNTSLNNTGARKIAALARFKEFQLEVTPRQALREFNQAHSSVAMTPSLFMPRKSTRKRKADTAVAPVDPVVVVSEDTSVEDLVEDDVSSEASSTVETAVSRRKSARLSRTSGMTMEDLDPDKDLTRPTSVPATLQPSEESLLLDDTNDATMMVSKPEIFLDARPASQQMFLFVLFQNYYLLEKENLLQFIKFVYTNNIFLVDFPVLTNQYSPIVFSGSGIEAAERQTQEEAFRSVRL